MNLLFICSRNKWRSLTAETIFKNHPYWEIKSAGTSNSARVRVSARLLEWADMIFVMESKHKKFILERFPNLVPTCEIHVLNIPDEYRYMDEDLITELNDVVSWFIDEYG